jgi:hypothetical protein
VHHGNWAECKTHQASPASTKRVTPRQRPTEALGVRIGHRRKPATVDGGYPPGPQNGPPYREGYPGCSSDVTAGERSPGSEDATLNDRRNRENRSVPTDRGPPQGLPAGLARPSTPGINPGRSGRLLTFRGGNGSHTTPPGSPGARFGTRGKCSEQARARPPTAVSFPARRALRTGRVHTPAPQSPTTVSFE